MVACMVPISIFTIIYSVGVILSHDDGGRAQGQPERGQVEGQKLKYVINLWYFPEKRYENIPRITAENVPGFRFFDFYNNALPEGIEGYDMIGKVTDCHTFDDCFMLCDYFSEDDVDMCTGGLYDRHERRCLLLFDSVCPENPQKEIGPMRTAHLIYFRTGPCPVREITSTTTEMATNTTAPYC